jgi:hypothetical protein
MTLFKNTTHQEVWIEHHCDPCCHSFKNSGEPCLILVRALTTGRKPREWERNTGKNQLMKDTMKCNAEARQLPKPQRVKTFEDVPMFDLEPHEVNYVPVEGLPTEIRPVSRATDHA